MLIREFWEGFQDGGWLPGEPTRLRGLELSVCPHLHHVGKKRNWRLNQASIANDFINYTYLRSLHKNVKVQGSESFWAGKHMVVLGKWRAQREHGKVRAPSPIPCPMHLYHLTASELYPFVEEKTQA